MTLEQQVTSLEISKRLKELGVKQDSFAYWIHLGVGDKWSWRVDIRKPRNFESISAFTVAELIELLGDKLGVVEHFKSGEWGVYIPNDIGVSSTGKYLPDVLAELFMKTMEMEDYAE